MTSSRILVVISHYDARPVKNLHNLLSTMEEHSAGANFDTCVVINQATGKTVEIPKLSFAVTAIARPNKGMNIGAWDFGWRENPDYDFYIFLQDECTVVRNGWLNGLIKPLMNPQTGMVGECINHRWCRAWHELNSEAAASQQVARRASLCLEILKARNVPAGQTGRHLRSLVWGFRKEVLQRLSGFPIGRDYDECIAAEIAVSRHVESFGLSVDQAHRSPFYYVGHTQWINTYPGFTASLSYSEWVRKHLRDPSLPFSDLGGQGGTTERINQLVARVETERGLFDARIVPTPTRGFIALLAVMIDRTPADRELLKTAHSWSLQSAPFVDLVFVPTNKFLLNKTKNWLAKPEYADYSQIRTCLLSEWMAQDLEGYQFALFARPGDQLHPSLASVLSILDRRERPDIVIWNEERTRPTEQGSWLFRQPRFSPLSIQTVGNIGMAFAVRPSWMKSFPFDFADDLLNNNAHRFHIWLSQDAKVRWTTHPEFLSSRQLREGTPLETFPRTRNESKEHYRQVLNRVNEASKPSAGNGHHNEQSALARRAGSVSVIVSFRDRPKETIACLKSLLDQQITARMEILLINNRSQDEPLAEVQQFIDICRRDQGNIRLINYDAPFNHSRQTNLGVMNSSGEVLVFLNNDAELMDQDVLEEMIAWALLPGIGTVGCRITDAAGGLLSSGIRVRSVVSGIQTSPVEESRDFSYSRQVREVVANTFACAAIARSRFDRIGWLNEVEFPNGYNDVEYCLRIRQRGYRNLYLGHLQVKHTPGTSRGRCDETFQKILLRCRYPELYIDSIFDLSYEWRPQIIASPPRPAAYGAEPPIGMKKALRILYRAMIFWVQRRIL